MSGMGDGLTKAQRAALDIAVEANDAFRTCTSRTADERDRALRRLFELGVPPAHIARSLGLTHGRVSQLARKLGFPAKERA